MLKSGDVMYLFCVFKLCLLLVTKAHFSEIRYNLLHSPLIYREFEQKDIRQDHFKST